MFSRDIITQLKLLQCKEALHPMRPHADSRGSTHLPGLLMSCSSPMRPMWPHALI